MKRKLATLVAPFEAGRQADRNLSERERAEQALRLARFSIDHAPDCTMWINSEGRFIDVSQSACARLGYSRDELLTMSVFDVTVDLWPEAWPDNWRVLREHGPLTFERQHKTKGGEIFPAEISSTFLEHEGRGYALNIVRDIAGRKQAEAYREMGREILQTLNEPGDLPDSIQRVLATLKTRTGSDAVGIRLHDGADFPYFVQDRFSPGFLLTEDTLIERTADGGVCRDKDGNVNLECTCGLVISGKTDPANRLFTPGGSCWTNDSPHLLDIPPGDDPRLHPRNQCIHHGYASVALVPIRDTEGIVGLIQLNDRRKGRFTLDTVRILEGIASHIGAALMRKRTEQELRESEARYRDELEIRVQERTAELVRANERAQAEVTERLQVEEGLREHERQLSSIYHTVGDTIFQLAVESPDQYRFTSVNASFYRITGLPPEAVVGRRVDEVIPEPSLSMVRRKYRQAIDEKAIVRWEETSDYPSGRLTGEVSIAPVFDTHGRCTHLVGSVHDVTARRQADEALRASEAMLNEVGRMAQVGGWSIDLAMGTLTWTKEVYAIHEVDETFEPTVESAIGFYVPEWRPVIEAAVQRAIDVGEPFDLEMELITAKGRRVWVHALGGAHPEEGPAEMVSGVLQDITERKRAEEALQQSEERLRQSQRLEAVGSLAGGIAHDFNNLLTAIIGQTELLRGTPHTSDEHRDGLDEIRSVADRAAGLTRQLLAFSRRQALQPRVVNVNDVAESMVGLLTRVLGEDIDLVFRGDPALWPVEADPGQLEQVIMNLAVNARDAMPQGGKLMIETANVDVDETYAAAHIGARAGPHVLLALSDTGGGMDGETLSRVFEPFFTTKEPGKGTGLGLSTAYGIVKQSGGNIWAYSNPGQGTTFKIYLPRAEKPIDWSPAANVAPVCPVRRGSETLLLVEDEPSVRNLTTRILAGQGYQVLAAGSPEEAITLVNEHPDTIDLILSDVGLPGMSGRALVDLLVDRPGFAPRVLYMSGYARDALVHQGRVDEGIALLEKPFTSAGLLRKLREVLDPPFEGQT